MKFFDDEIPDKPVLEDIDPKKFKPNISPWDWAKSITETKNYLMVSEAEEKLFNSQVRVVWKALSFEPDTVIPANEMNARPHLDAKLQYDFLINIVRRRKRNLWVKAETIDALAVIQEYYGYSNEKAIQVLPLLSQLDIETMRKRTRKGGLNG